MQSCFNLVFDKGQLISKHTIYPSLTLKMDIEFEFEINSLPILQYLWTTLTFFTKILHCHRVENLLELLDYNLSHTLVWHLAMINPDWDWVKLNLHRDFPGVFRPDGPQWVEFDFEIVFFLFICVFVRCLSL